MGGSNTLVIDNDNTVVADKLPEQFGNSVPESNKDNRRTVVTFIDESVYNFKPNIEYYREIYASSGYPPEVVDSLIIGLSESSVYESKTSK